jgi:DNA-binding transcriptional LysR family regulator
MDLNQLRTFRVLTATLSFSRTAQLLDYAQSSVSAQIRSLEDELGAPLFQRSGRRVQMTEAGRRMLQYSERMLALEDDARAALAGPQDYEDVVRVGAPESVMTYVLPGLLRRFQDMFPKVRLFFKPLVDADLYDGVTNGRLDFAILLQPPVRVEHLETRVLSEEPLWVIAPPGHRLARRRKVQAGDTAGETVILTDTGCGYRHLFEQELAKAGNYACQRLEFNSIEAIKRCVGLGLGLGFLPRFAVTAAVTRGELARVRWEKPFSAQAQLVWHKKRWPSAVGTSFIELCGEWPAAAPAERARSAGH